MTNNQSLSTIKESFVDKIEIIKNDFECLINSANKMVNKVKDEETNNDNMIKQFKKYETIESDIVKLNVGGTMFSTLKSTLTKKIEDKDGKLYLPNMFESLVDGFVKPKYDENKAIFIDRNPKYFGCILDYLRMANTDFEYELASSIDQNELLKEAKFYNIQGLVDMMDTYCFDSIILNTEDAKKNLFKICEFPSKTKLRLLYRATTDGFSAQNFHSKCDHLKKTLTIIKTTGNYIFGGYTEQSWDGNSCYKSDPNAFIFTTIRPACQAFAIYCRSYYGPWFGSGPDIQIFSNFNSHNQNSSITESYGSQSTYLAGSQQFTVSQIEKIILKQLNFKIKNSSSRFPMDDILELVDNWPTLGQGQHPEYAKKHHSMIRSLATLVKDLKNELENQKKIIEEQKKQIETLQTTRNPPALTYAGLVARNQKKTESEVALLAKVHNELKEKSNIERNIIVSGLPESTGEEETEINEKEKVAVEDLMKELGVAASSVKRFNRLKKRGTSSHDNAKPSLLLIELRSRESQQTVLSNAHLLKNSDNFNRIYVNPDKTLTERISEAELRKERNRLNKGLPNDSGNAILRYGIKNNKRYYYGIRNGRIIELEPKH
ncbi:BTB POZ domain-containing KCTD21 [Brachionus plicatilis]|uniref:BTB POZ domain-containing KCTD21 n=1 Tax=Brachionus plicatilis TaxID=10195 RepID=A0A3M7RA08_BRAPC|nr:BTB POZ domain-containing KCTD21 [Brachionus plicatilis]